jgi:23S rRNA pseudouridine1911/1915/1917 synthase
MRRVLSVSEGEAGSRLDQWLLARLSEPTLTRSRLQKLIQSGAVQLNGQPARAGLRLRPHDIVIIELPEDAPEETLEPEPFTLPILYEDEHIIAIDKPAGMVVYPAAGHPRGTVLNQLISHCALASFGAPARPGVVHRLDEGTSGVLVLAKTDLAYLKLVEQFKNRQIEKIYLAVVHGRIAEDEGRIEGPIGRDPAHRQRMRIVAAGKPAITEFRVLKRFDEVTVLEVRPLTGRTHQIRVHLSAIGHPVVGDDLYGPGFAWPDFVWTVRLRRPMAGEAVRSRRSLGLHAWHMKLAHPITGERLELVAPIPVEFLPLLQGYDDILTKSSVGERDAPIEHKESDTGENREDGLEQEPHQPHGEHR